jgi:uncharacterized protein (TIGR03083 family)
MTTIEMACDERQEFADLLSQLSLGQWDHASLCERWRVRDVVAHVVSYDELKSWAVVRRMARAGFIPNRANAIGVAEYANRTPGQLAELMRACIPPRGLTAGFGGMIALVDGMIHQQDIRRPLGIPRDIPAQRLRTVLDYALTVPAVRGAWRTRRVRLIATDMDWTHGSGPEAAGPAEALLMVMAGRPAALDQLSGSAKIVLAQRFYG